MLTKEELLAKAKKPAEDAMKLHPFYRGKVQTALKCAVRDVNDFAIWYTPGVAAPCRAIKDDPALVFEYTNRANTVAIVSDGTRVLGLGDIGPEAAMPVMEGKALLFKYLGGVDAAPICLNTKDPYRIMLAVKLIQPSFGGINLEDISQPKCFRVLDLLRTDPEVQIPVWHDDQQGTATVILAGVINALKIVGKKREEIKVALIGTGAANVATLRLLIASGIQWDNVCACDSKGILHPERKDIEARKIELVDKWRICQNSNAEERRGGPAEAMRGADLCIAFSKPGPGTILPEWVSGMNEDAIIFPAVQPYPGDLALGGQRGRGAHRGHGAFRFRQPGEQLAGLPGHLSRRAGRASEHHHRRDGHRRRRGAGSLRRGAGDQRGQHPPQHGRVGGVSARGSGRGPQGSGAGRGPSESIAGRALPNGRDEDAPGTRDG